MPTAMACDRTHTFLRAMSLHIGISVVLHNGFLNVQTITEPAVSQKYGWACRGTRRSHRVSHSETHSVRDNAFVLVRGLVAWPTSHTGSFPPGRFRRFWGYFDSNQLSPNPKSTLSGTSSGSVFSISDRTSAITSWTCSLGHSTTSSS